MTGEDVAVRPWLSPNAALCHVPYEDWLLPLIACPPHLGSCRPPRLIIGPSRELATKRLWNSATIE